MGFIGQKFTWMAKRGVGDEIWVRLDRSLCSMEWRLLYPEGFVRHLPRMNSDHCPLLIQPMSSQISNGHHKPFRFQAMWLKSNNFSNVVSNAWGYRNMEIGEKVGLLSKHLIQWNKNEFRCIFKNKRRLLARIQGIQNILSRSFRFSLDKLEKKLIHDYNTIVEQEEIFWLQKFRNC
ncbi:hypothetical protein ACOSQ2_004065 [Xanthoceras sorbifolium]